MMQFFGSIEQWFRLFASQVPLEWFVFLGSLFEEIFSFIPASLVMGITGSLALADGRSLVALVFLALIGNVARLFGAYFYYWIGDRLEDILIPRLQRLFGVGHAEVESIGQRFSGHHWKDGGALFMMRATPFFPVTLTSIACGIVKINTRVFLIASFLGNFVKDLGYMVLGYAGLASLNRLWQNVNDYKYYADILAWVAVAAFLGYLYLHRGAGVRIFERCLSKLRGMKR